MVSDPELDLIEQERERKKQASDEGTITGIEGHPEGTLIEKAEETPVIPEVEGPEDSLIQHDSGFVSRMDIVKQQVLQDASESDQSFVETIKENVKQAAVVHTEVEKEKASLEKQSVQYEQEKLSTKQKRTSMFRGRTDGQTGRKGGSTTTTGSNPSWSLWESKPR